MKTLSQAFTRFCFVKTMSGLKETSLTSYQTHVSLFIQSVGDVLVNDLEKDVVENYIYSLFSEEKNLAPSSRTSYIIHLKSFLRFLEKEYHICIDADDIKVPRPSKKIVHIYSNEQILEIFKTLKLRDRQDQDEWLKPRDILMVALMLDSGLRQSEVIHMKYDDIYKDTNILKIHGKGDKERLVPLGSFTKACMKEYERACPYSTEDYYIVNRIGKPMSKNAMQLFTHRLQQKLNFKFSCHRLRHNFATNFLLDQYKKKGHTDIYALKTLMGHESMTTTLAYLHLANQIIFSREHISHLDTIFEKYG